MAFNTVYNFDAQTGGNNGDWIFNSPAATGLKASGTTREWSWENNETPSSNVGPLTGQSSAGYIYTEMSNPGANGDVFNIELSNALDASTNLITMSFYYSARTSNAADDAFLTVQAYDGSSWITVNDLGNINNATDAGWVLVNTDFSAYTNSTFKIRIVITMGSGGTAWHKDIGLDSITITGTDRNEDIGPTTDDDTNNNEINESAVNGTVVGITALATDADAGDTISYSLTDDAGGRFTIDSTTGVVTVADTSLIVYANNTNHDITIRSTSSDGTFSELVTNIQVIDNSPRPISELSDENLSQNIINEICNNGDPVGITAFAEDPNVGEDVTYSLDDDAGGRFSIDPTTGIVTVADADNIVFADNNVHVITVRATSDDNSSVTANYSIDVQKEILAQLASTNKFNTIKTNGIIRVKLGAVPDDLNILGHLIIEENIDINNLNILNGKLEFETAGTLTATDCIIADVTNTSGGNITIYSNRSTFLVNTGPNINIINSNILEFTGLVAGTEVRLYAGSDPSTAVEVPGGTEDSGNGSFSFSHGEGGNNGYARIYAIGYEDIYLPFEPIPNIDTSIPIQQRVDRWYKNN